jgi:S1-C subfamily serine protease
VGAPDKQLWDAYSQTVSGVVERVGPSVAAVRTPAAQDRGKSGSASGFLFTPDGYLLTNSHVVRAGTAQSARGKPKVAYQVLLDDGRQFAAEWVGDDADTDLAALHIDGQSKGALLHARGDVIVGLDGVDVDSVDCLHQTLDASRIRRECSLKLLRGVLSPQPLSVMVRPTERA